MMMTTPFIALHTFRHVSCVYPYNTSLIRMKINWFFVCALKTQRNENQLNKTEQTHIQAHTHVHFFPSIFLCTVYEHTHTCMYVYTLYQHIYIYNLTKNVNWTETKKTTKQRQQRLSEQRKNTNKSVQRKTVIKYMCKHIHIQMPAHRDTHTLTQRH